MMSVSILVVALLFSFWGLVSYIFVSPVKLAQSTVPYSITARAVFGDTGRVIVGAAVLAGCCASANALLRSVSLMIGGMTEKGLLPSFLGAASHRVPLILLSIGIAAMMAVGMAGEPKIEIYARTGLYFWLLTYAAVPLSFLITYKHSFKGTHAITSIIQITCIIAFFSAVFGLVFTDPEREEVIKYMCVSAMVIALFSGLRGWEIGRKE
jgi:amino acid transporter